MNKDNCGNCEFLDKTKSRDFYYANKEDNKEFSGKSYFCKKRNCYVTEYSACDNKYLSLSQYIFSRRGKIKKTYNAIQRIIRRNEDQLREEGALAKIGTSKYCYVIKTNRLDALIGLNQESTKKPFNIVTPGGIK